MYRNNCEIDGYICEQTRTSNLGTQEYKVGALRSPSVSFISSPSQTEAPDFLSVQLIAVLAGTPRYRVGNRKRVHCVLVSQSVNVSSSLFRPRERFIHCTHSQSPMHDIVNSPIGPTTDFQFVTGAHFN